MYYQVSIHHHQKQKQKEKSKKKKKINKYIKNFKKLFKNPTKTPIKHITFNDILIRYRRAVLPVTNCIFFSL